MKSPDFRLRRRLGFAVSGPLLGRMAVGQLANQRPRGKPLRLLGGGGYCRELKAQDSEGSLFLGSSRVNEGSAVCVSGRRVPGSPGSASTQPWYSTLVLPPPKKAAASTGGPSAVLSSQPCSGHLEPHDAAIKGISRALLLGSGCSHTAQS